MRNLGHRLGASGTKLENTVQGLHNSLKIVSDSNFRYWEFDVRESADGTLFVFHDDDMWLKGKLIETRLLEMGEIISAGEEIGIRIPTLDEVMSELEQREEPVMVDIKEIMTDECRVEIIDLVVGKKCWKLMATPKRFENSFPVKDRDRWREMASQKGVKLVRVGRHRVQLFRFSDSALGRLFLYPKWLFGF
ncbi:MAG: hypothetical protein CBD52_002635 [Euryarchaeota archaeon TMED192]|nr:MAG: hypothetical protein CBD52_002635 [Euryarchaeota archaeon TMED192]|tara:strand:+ start:2349 stop:2924 length:576 start_codon:yes stop_codon:yes gene_type:complete